MKTMHILLLSLAVAAPSCASGGRQAPESLAAVGPASPAPRSGAPEFPDSAAVVVAYLKAVDRGELVVFDCRLDHSMITPRRVEYRVGLDSPVRTVRVHADLRQPMAVPDQSGYEVRAVTSSLDDDGTIVETELHIWQK